MAGGTPTLAGIAVALHRRGEGWGAAVTAHLTRVAVEATGACALGMFADNDVARRLYHRLGFTTGMEWTSRWFGDRVRTRLDIGAFGCGEPAATSRRVPIVADPT